MISPKSKLKALVMKLLTVMVKPEVNAKRHPRANLILALLLSLANSSSDKRLSSTEKKEFIFNHKMFSLCGHRSFFYLLDFFDPMNNFYTPLSPEILP